MPATLWARLAELPQRLLMALVRGYRYLLKPWLGHACRFEPTCSAYALLALQRHGALRGTALSAGRILRCQPWCAGGCDPVPENPTHPATGLFTRLRTAPPAQAPEQRPPPSPTRKTP